MYLETTAFPAFYHQAVNREFPESFLQNYSQTQRDAKGGAATVLHLFRDYHSYAPLEPYSDGEQKTRTRVLKSIQKAMMLGIIETTTQTSGNRISLPIELDLYTRTKVVAQQSMLHTSIKKL